MSFEDQLKAEHAQIIAKRDDVVKTMAVQLFGDLQVVSPVGENRPSRPWKRSPNRMTKSYQGGELRQSWQPPEKIIGGWKITNIAPHASTIDGGRRQIGGKWYGSEQLMNGFEPTVLEAERVLNQELKAIK